ncbi:MAG: hypothetical protein K0R72_84 [Clostridia bacterium]|jgi:hypothetical protein|nr:hypothetical protein [Clostridia bacterium]
MIRNFINVTEKTKHHFLYLVFPGFIGFIYTILGIISLKHEVNMSTVSVIVLAITFIVPIFFEVLFEEINKKSIGKILCNYSNVMQRMCLSIILTMFIYTVVSVFTSNV